MLPYATLTDFSRMKSVKQPFSTDGNRLVRDYLARATQYIDATTRRRFYPFHETRMYGVPTVYADLRNRGLLFDDLLLDADLLDAEDVRTATGSVDGETTLAGAITRTGGALTVADATGIAVGAMLLIEQEIVRVRAVAGAVLTVDRGAHQTRAAAHDNGVTVGLLAFTVLAPGLDYFTLDFNKSPKYALRLTYPNSWAGPYSGSRWLWREPQIFVSGLWGYNERYGSGAWIDTRNAIGAGGVTASATTITVTNAYGADGGGVTPALEEGMLLRIEDELLWCTAVGSNVASTPVTVVRGVHGSLAAAHAEGAVIERWSVHEEIREACLVIAKTWKDADDSVGGRQGVSDMSAGVQIAMPADITAILKRYVKSVGWG